jgi:histidine ammonia-lyase
MSEMIIDGESLTFEQVVAVAYGKPGEPRVTLSEEAKAKVNRSAAAVQTLLDRGEVAYGITTGFGAFKDKIISREEVELLQRNIVVSHAVGVGDPLDTATVRAIMLIRANTLSRGFSGIRLETIQLILDCLDRGVHPVIPEKGSLGASGDLAPLAHFACVLIGEGEAEFQGDLEIVMSQLSVQLTCHDKAPHSSLGPFAFMSASTSASVAPETMYELARMFSAMVCAPAGAADKQATTTA